MYRGGGGGVDGAGGKVVRLFRELELDGIRVTKEGSYVLSNKYFGL